MDEAIAHINRYSSHHTDAIVTRDHMNAQRFLREVDSASVMVNASTVSPTASNTGWVPRSASAPTSSTPAARSAWKGLTSLKWVVLGQGEVRSLKTCPL